MIDERNQPMLCIKRPKIHVFDLDGTLCYHGHSVDALTAETVMALALHDDCEIHICTASTIGRTRDRIQELIKRKAIDKVWCGHGTTELDGEGNFIKRHVRKEISPELYAALVEIRQISDFKDQGRIPLSGDGSCYSFSVLGKRFTPQQREAFVEFDRRTDSRLRHLKYLAKNFPEWNFYLGGQTGIDFVPKPFGKDAVIDRLLARTDRITYYGDDFGEHGGDAAAKELLLRTKEKWRLDEIEVVEIDVYKVKKIAHANHQE